MNTNPLNSFSFLLLSHTVEAESSQFLVRTWMWSRSQKWGLPSVLVILSLPGGGEVWLRRKKEAWTEDRITRVRWRDGGGLFQRRTALRGCSAVSNRCLHGIVQKWLFTALILFKICIQGLSSFSLPPCSLPVRVSLHGEQLLPHLVPDPSRGPGGH